MIKFNIVSICVVFALASINFENVQGQRVYNENEKAAIVKFRELMGDELYKDYMKSEPYLIRWLRARDFNLEEARNMLRNALKWRKANKIDGILDEKVFEFTSPPFYYDGMDYEGSVVTTMLPARVDMRRYLLNGKRPEAIRYWDQLLETAEITVLTLLGVIGNSSAPKEARVDQTTVVMDMHGYTLRQHACVQCISVYLEWFLHMENYYPGYTKHFIIINAPRIAIPLIELLKPAMSPATRRALRVYGSNKNEWLPVLQKLIPPDQVRANLGGTKPE